MTTRKRGVSEGNAGDGRNPPRYHCSLYEEEGFP